MPEEKKGIKETLELIEGLKVVVPAGVEIAADKQLSMKDIKPVVDVVKKYEVVADAVAGFGDIVLEAKDLDQVELAQIGTAFLGLLPLVKEAYVRGK